MSGSITLALDNSEYLLVICSPRLKESIWCKNEIETFIAKNGREKVLAVLIEGEPADSFPDAITKEVRITTGPDGSEIREELSIEPLAADVRGKNKAEIKKKIREGVVRLAAAMFECNYDEIRQRHREQAMRLRMRIATVITLASLAFGGIFFYQAIQIQKQGEMINEQYQQIQNQYVEIEMQYADNIVKQTEIVGNQIQSYLKDGNIEDAKSLLLETYNMAKDNMPDKAYTNLRYLFSELENIYDNGNRYLPVANLSMPSSILKYILSPDCRYLAACDMASNLYVWDLESLELVFSDNIYNYNIYNSTKDIIFDMDNNLYCRGKDALYCIDCTTGEYRWKSECGIINYFSGIGNGKILITQGNDYRIISRDTGELLESHSLDYELGEYIYQSVTLCSDRNSVIIASAYKKGYLFSKMDIQSCKVTNSIVIPNINIGCVADDGKGHFLISASLFDGRDVPNSAGNFYCVDEDTLEIVWVKEKNNFCNEMFEWAGCWLLVYSTEIEFLDANSFEVITKHAFGGSITDRIINVYDDLVIYTNDGYRLIYGKDLTYIRNDSSRLEMPDISIHKCAGKYDSALKKSGNRIVLYDTSLAPNAELLESGESHFTEFFDKYNDAREKETEYTAECLDGKVFVKKNNKSLYEFEADISLYRQIFVFEEIQAVIIYRIDNIVEIRGWENGELLLSVDVSSDYYVIDLCDDYFGIGDFSNTYIINKKNFGIEADVKGFYDYDEKKQEFIISSSAHYDMLYTVPFLKLEELVENIEE